MIDYSAYKFFSREEFAFPDAMDTEFLAMLDRARAFAGVPFRITSSFREGDPLSHGYGQAVDIACVTSRERFWIVSGCLNAGFQRIGVYPKHVHVDNRLSLPHPVLFTGGYDRVSSPSYVS